MKFISRTHRCANSYRGAKLEIEGLGSCQHPYLLQVCRHPGISQDQIARRLCVNKSNVTRHLGALEQNGFITRSPAPDDRRALRVYPTELALGVFPQVQALMQEWNELLLEGFTQEERQTLTGMLERVLDRARELTESENGRRKK